MVPFASSARLVSVVGIASALALAATPVLAKSPDAAQPRTPAARSAPAAPPVTNPAERAPVEVTFGPPDRASITGAGSQTCELSCDVTGTGQVVPVARLKCTLVSSGSGPEPVQSLKPIPGIGIVVKKHPGGSAERITFSPVSGGSGTVGPVFVTKQKTKSNQSNERRAQPSDGSSAAAHITGYTIELEVDCGGSAGENRLLVVTINTSCSSGYEYSGAPVVKITDDRTGVEISSPIVKSTRGGVDSDGDAVSEEQLEISAKAKAKPATATDSGERPGRRGAQR